MNFFQSRKLNENDNIISFYKKKIKYIDGLAENISEEVSGSQAVATSGKIFQS